MYLIFSFAVMALIVFALVDAIISRDDQVKHLPKIAWILLIVFLPLIGSLAWLIAGKDRAMPQFSGPAPAPAPERREAPSTTEQELAALDREIEYFEKQEKLRRLEAELEEKRRGKTQP